MPRKNKRRARRYMRVLLQKREKEHQLKVNELRATNDTLKDQLESTLDSKQKPKKKK